MTAPTARTRQPGLDRREFLAASIFGWIPFLRPKHVTLAGARFRIIRYGHSKRRYLVIHGNEETAREVLQYHMRAHEGIGLRGREPDPQRSDRGRPDRPEPDVFPRRRRGQPEKAESGLDARTRQDGSRPARPSIATNSSKNFCRREDGITIALHNNGPGYSVADEQPISDAGLHPRAGQPARVFPLHRSGRFQDSLPRRPTMSCCSRRRRPPMTVRFPGWPPRAAPLREPGGRARATTAARRKCWTGWSGTWRKNARRRTAPPPTPPVGPRGGRFPLPSWSA